MPRTNVQPEQPLRAPVAERSKINRVAEVPDPFPIYAADYFLPMVDPVFWGLDKPDKGPRPVNVKAKVQSHLAGRDKARLLDADEVERNYRYARRGEKNCRMFYTTGRESAVALVRVDIDAHDIELDADRDDVDAATHVSDVLFTGLYSERSSGRGHAVYLMLDIAGQAAADVNASLRQLERTILASFRDRGFRSTVEVQGGITPVEGTHVGTYAQLAAFPILRRGLPDLYRIIDSPRVTTAELADLIDAQPVTAELKPMTPAARRPRLTRPILLHRDGPMASSPGSGHVRRAKSSPEARGGQEDCVSVDAPQHSKAFRRMCAAAHDFDRRSGRPATAAELMEHYEAVHPDVDAAHPARWRRAEYVVKTFRPRARKNSWAEMKPAMLATVRTHCAPDSRTDKYPYVIDEVSLAAVLYLITWTAFIKAPYPKRQWTLSRDGFKAGLRHLMQIDPDLKCGNLNKMIAARTILWRSQLVDCLDESYLPAGRENGLAKKWVLGEKHPRYQECRTWATENGVYWEPACGQRDRASVIRVA